MGTARVRIRAVLFDLGGTLVDERDYLAWAEVARVLPLDVHPEEMAHAYVEVESEIDAEPLRLDPEAATVEFWRRVLARASDRPVRTELAVRFLEARRAAARDPPSLPLFSDVRRCLDRLRVEHRRLGVVSNAQGESRVRRILDAAGILGYFERVVASGTEGVAKPEPEIFHRAVARLAVAPSEALYVGNLRRTDALGARAAGLHSVWLHRDGTGLGSDPPEITSLLEVPVVVRQLEARPVLPAGPGLK